MRGTPPRRSKPTMPTRIIPAYAGNTAANGSPFWSRRDHPRVCGEHVVDEEPWPDVPGSSPRMRGTRPRRQNHVGRGGIIPAYAGNTFAIGSRWRRHRDHPRVCGEHFMLAVGVGDSCGSSPRMRGTRRLHRLLRGRPGIIPAYAGNTNYRQVPD